MNIFILGGTKFVGRHLVEAALAAGHTLTLFNRGQTDPTLFPQVELIKGDRDGGLEPLADRKFDAVIDTCGYVPRVVKQAAQFFSQSAALYVFISTISVYKAEKGASRIDERTPVAQIENTATEEITGETYGALKALCEHVIREEFPTRALFIRPGIIAGPYDPTDRFTYWAHRIAHSKRIIAPGDGTQPIQIIDARDLAHWIIQLIERQCTGFYNAVGPAVPMTMKRILTECISATTGGAEVVWLSKETLQAHGVTDDNFPLWLPEKDDWWLFSVDPARAISAGLTLRPVAATAADTVAWADQLPEAFQPKTGLNASVEAKILAAESAVNPI
jgi:2'-hydroxyisoflavone reductase